MKRTYLFFIAIFIAFTLRAQTVTLRVQQPEPLDASIHQRSFDILMGNTLLLGEGLDISGGTPPYLIEWRNSADDNDTICNLLSVSPSDTTIYTCTIIDSLGCSLSQTIVVNVISPLELEISKRDISCFGANDGFISLNISGGAQPYSTAWSTGVHSNELSRLTPGDYVATIADAFGQKIDTIISIIELPQITSWVNQTICANQTYNFNGKLLKSTGEYVDTLQTSNGCDSIITLNLIVYPTFVSSIDVAICSGETYTFQGVALNSTGQYTDSLTTISGCDSLIVCNLVVNDLPDNPTVSISGDTLTSTVAESYQWFQSNELLEGQTNQTLVITETGNYKVEITNEQKCSNQSDNYNVTYTAIAEFSSPKFDLKVYPNPNKGLFTVEIDTENNEAIVLELFSLDGKLLAQKQLDVSNNSRTIRFGKDNLMKGTYTLRVQYGTKTVSRKLIVN